MPATPSPSAPRGVLSAATGEAYLEVARRSARSLRESSETLPIQLFSEIADTSGPFDSVTLPDNAQARSKVDAIANTPFDGTLYLDCDTIVGGGHSGRVRPAPAVRHPDGARGAVASKIAQRESGD